MASAKFPAFLLVAATIAFAGPSSKTIRAVWTAQPPILDGVVDEGVWCTASAALDFTQFDPVEGGLPTELTSVRVLYDNTSLYVGVICYDSYPEKIVRHLSRRDRNTEADRFVVMIDSYYDKQTAFVFSTNVSGVQSDGVLSQDGTVYDITWDAVWTVKTRVYRDGWSAEFVIPYDALRFSRQEDGNYTWGINFRRYISRKKETDEWVMVPRSERLQISKWGTLTGITRITPPLHLELLPYASGSARYETAAPDRPRSSEYKGLAGFDLKYGLSRNFTLDATVNPDYGQVEVDQAVLNLTVFEPRFPEKRPFFIEGAPVFSFGSSIDNTPLSLFFSRRIGKRPAGSSTVVPPVGGRLMENPEVTTILGAAKVTGRTGGGLSLGAVSAMTDNEDAVVEDAAGGRSTIRTEPSGSYNVVRLKQEFEGGSWVGGMATVVSRQTMLPAISGGADWNVRFDDGLYTMDGYLAGARSSASAGKRDGAAGRLLLSRMAAEHWFPTLSYDFATPAFNINDAGFFAQPHDHGGYCQLIYRENFASGVFRRYFVAVNPEARWNWDRVMTHGMARLEWYGEFTNFWLAVATYEHWFPAYDDAERGIIGTYERPASDVLQVNVTSDERSSLSGTLTGRYEFDALRKRAATAALNVTVRPTTWMELSPMLLYQKVQHEEAWLFPDGNIVDPALGSLRFSVYGERTVEELDGALRGIVTFTRSLSLQFYTQVLLARGTYSDYKRLAIGGVLAPYDYQAFPGFVSHDFNEVTFNANVLLRWEYLPGSTVYCVWTQGRYGDNGNYATGFGQRLRDTFLLSHQDVLLMKISYWLPL
jgi:hypothetical protein